VLGQEAKDDARSCCTGRQEAGEKCSFQAVTRFPIALKSILFLWLQRNPGMRVDGPVQRPEFDRQAAGSHEIWFNSTTKRYTTIPNHPGDLPEGTLRAILRQAEIDPDDFVGA